MSTTSTEAARELLDAHKALRSSYESEPPADDDGLPIDRYAWLEWHDDVMTPAHARWWSALLSLEKQLGHKISHHPFNFIPLCEQILREE